MRRADLQRPADAISQLCASFRYEQRSETVRVQITTPLGTVTSTSTGPDGRYTSSVQDLRGIPVIGGGAGAIGGTAPHNLDLDRRRRRNERPEASA